MQGSEKAVPTESESSGRRVHDLLSAAAAPLSVAQIVEVTGLHANTVRSHLALLMDMGRVESVPEPRTGPGRPRLLYRAVVTTPQDPYRALAVELAAGVSDGRPGDTPGLAAGRRLARTQREKSAITGPLTPDQAVALATDGLDVLGFETSTDPLGDRLYLSVCPFLEMAREDRAICRLHHEMLRGFFGELDAGVGVRRLDIFVKGDLCVAHLDRPDLRRAPAAAAAAPDPEA
ncbi:MAG: hypothetical protein U0S36_02715 [Candidatus Nanopelagicales bacterium]